MPLLTIPLLLTTVLAVRHMKKRNKNNKSHRHHSTPQTKLDPRVVSATIVLSALPTDMLEQTLEFLPPDIARSIVFMIPELPPIAKSTIEQERQRWLSHFSPPRHSFEEIRSEHPQVLAAVTVKLILEDSL